jgi:choline transport protein
MAIPLNAVLFSASITAIICLINIASSVAFNAIVSLTIAGLFSSYFIPIALITSKRLTSNDIRWGPWKLGAKMGFAINIFSMCFLAISIVFSFFPPGIPVTLVSMNWSILVFGGAVVLGILFYIVRGHKNYNGPIVERTIIPSDELESR